MMSVRFAELILAVAKNLAVQSDPINKFQARNRTRAAIIEFRNPSEAHAPLSERDILVVFSLLTTSEGLRFNAYDIPI